MTRKEAVQILTIERHSHHTGSIVEKAIDMAISALADPIHYAGGCYCRECEFKENCNQEIEHTVPVNFVSDTGIRKCEVHFCSYGRRREGADG